MTSMMIDIVISIIITIIITIIALSNDCTIYSCSTYVSIHMVVSHALIKSAIWFISKAPSTPLMDFLFDNIARY